MSIVIQYPYEKRETRFLQLWQHEGWAFKIYGITHPRKSMPTPNSQLVQAALELTRQRIQEIKPDDHHNAGFVIIHQGREANFVLLDWWTAENTIHQNLYTSEPDDPCTFVNIDGSGLMACVWEINVQSFERDAWISYVLDTQNTPDLNGYFQQQLNGFF